MNFRQLETFYWATKLGSFTAAASQLNATQSTISMRIQELESEFGVSLFDRSKRKAKVTREGQTLIPYVEKLLRISSDMLKIISTPEATEGNIRIGVVEIISLTWLSKLMRTLHDRYPKIVFELDEALTEDLVESFNHGTLDLILVPGRISGKNLSLQSLGLVDFQWMGSPKLCDQKKIVTPVELQKWPIIALSEQSFHFTRIKNWFSSGQGTYRQDYTCKTVGVAHRLAKDGLGVALLPVQQYTVDLNSGNLCLIKTKPPMTPVEFFAISQERPISSVIQDVSEIAKEISDFQKNTNFVSY